MSNQVIPGIQCGNSVWYGQEIVNRKSEWLFTLTEYELVELLTAADKLVASSNPEENLLSLEFLNNMNLDVELPIITARIKCFIEQLHCGLGFFVWRGIPVARWSRKQVAASFLIISKCIGNLRQQNSQGHVLGHVKDLGLDISGPNVRFYQTKERISYHADFCDVVGLLCLRSAKSGGMSSLVSSGAIYNEMFKTDRNLLSELLQPIATDKRGEILKGTLPYYNIPVFNYYDGHLTTCYAKAFIESAQRFPQARRLTPNQKAALNLFDSLANDPRLHLNLEFIAGDMQFVHNHTLLHERTAFEDWVEPERKRHLLRVWLAPLNSRLLPPIFAERFGSVTVGDRGGSDIQGFVPIAPVDV